jgi:hypothetical protein
VEAPATGTHDAGVAAWGREREGRERGRIRRDDVRVPDISGSRMSVDPQNFLLNDEWVPHVCF